MRIEARRSSVSQQSLHDDPTLSSNEPSGSTTIVRVECPPVRVAHDLAPSRLAGLVVDLQLEERLHACDEQRAIVREGQ